MPDIDRALADLELLAERQLYNRLAYFKPYQKQRDFIALHGRVSEAALLAGNRVGKSEIGAFIMATHMTGRYPAWWDAVGGPRIDKQRLRAWVAGPSGLLVRDTVQRKLLGSPGVPEDLGTGFLPKDTIVGKPSTSRSAQDAVDTVHVKHVNGSVGSLTFKTYEQERRHWQGEAVDLIWYDEEPTLELYVEGQARTLDTSGRSFCTFTPLEGFNAVVPLYLYERNERRDFLKMSMMDASHLGPEKIAEAKMMWPKIEWEARIEGNPTPGTGRVYTAEQSQIEWTVPARIPDEWLKIWGVDFGIDHPFAAALCAWDRDTNTFYVLNGFAIRSELILQHAKRIREMGGNIPVAWPHDGHVRDKQSGEPLAAVYRKEGVLMLDEHAKLPDGSNSIYASVNEINEWMNAGRFRVCSSLTDWYKEYITYHYDNGLIVKKNDDFLSATRYAWMMRRRGKPGPITAGGPLAPRDKRRPITHFDLHTGMPFPEGDPRRYQ